MDNMPHGCDGAGVNVNLDLSEVEASTSLRGTFFDVDASSPKLRRPNFHGAAKCCSGFFFIRNSDIFKTEENASKFGVVFTCRLDISLFEYDRLAPILVHLSIG